MAEDPPPAGKAALAARRRKRALLLEARRQRLAWVQDDDYEEPEAPADALFRALEGQDKDADDAVPSGWRRGRVSELLQRAASGGTNQPVPVPSLLLPPAREYVAFLNRLAEEADAETVVYPAAALLPRLPEDAELLFGPDAGDEEEEGEDEGDDDVAMPPLPPAAAPTQEGGLSYEAFLARLGHPLSSEVVQTLQRFVSSFVRKQRRRERQGEVGSPDEMAQGLHAFIDSLRGEMRKSLAWRDVLLQAEENGEGGGGSGWEEVREHLETFLVTKLHRYLFTAQERRELQAQDAALRERLAALAFLGPEHLDVRSLLGAPSLSPSKAQPPSQSQILAPAIAALRRAAEQRAPRAIMAHLLAASRHVTRALVACRRDGTLPGADEVLPTLILAVKEGNPPGLRVALEVAQRYRQPKGLQVSEAAYVFTNVASAVHFLQTADAAQLNMTPDDLDRSLAACRLATLASVSSPFSFAPAAAAPAAVDPLLVSLPSLQGAGVPTPRAQEGDDDGAVEALLASMSLGSTGFSTIDASATMPAATAAAAAAAAAEATGPSSPPKRLVSIHEIRARTSTSSAHNTPTSSSFRPPPLPPPPSSSAPTAPTGIAELAARVRGASISSGSSSSHLPEPADVMGGCRFLGSTPEELRLWEVGALLEEYRALATLAADLAGLLREKGRNG